MTSPAFQKAESDRYQVIHQISTLMQDMPDRFCVESQKNEYVSSFTARTQLGFDNRPPLSLAVSMSRYHTSGLIKEQVLIHDPSQQPSETALYRLDITSGPEIEERYKLAKCIIDENPNCLNLVGLLDCYNQDTESGSITEISDTWDQTRISAGQAGKLFNRARYTIPANYQGPTLKDFQEELERRQSFHHLGLLLPG